MPLRIFMVMVLMFSHASAWRLAMGIDPSAPNRVQTHQMDQGAYGCPMCEIAEYFQGYVPECDCGCSVSETPMPDSPSDGAAMVPSLDRYVPSEIEITRIVAMGMLDLGSGTLSTASDQHITLDGGVHQFLATTGHWIL